MILGHFRSLTLTYISRLMSETLASQSGGVCPPASRGVNHVSFLSQNSSKHNKYHQKQTQLQLININQSNLQSNNSIHFTRSTHSLNSQSSSRFVSFSLVHVYLIFLPPLYTRLLTPTHIHLVTTPNYHSLTHSLTHSLAKLVRSFRSFVR